MSSHSIEDSTSIFPSVSSSTDNGIVAVVSERKSTPDQLLQQLETEEENQSRGRLKIFLGYASGVGKSFKMLDEGRRRFERGQDVIIGASQPNLSREVAQAMPLLRSFPCATSRGAP